MISLVNQCYSCVGAHLKPFVLASIFLQTLPLYGDEQTVTTSTGNIHAPASFVVPPAPPSYLTESDPGEEPSFAPRHPSASFGETTATPLVHRLADDSAVEEGGSACDSRCQCTCPSCRGCGEEDSGTETLLGECGDQCIDGIFEKLLGWKDDLDLPIGAGAWHWYAEDISTSNDGYGTRGLRGTYWWYITADPEYDLGDGRKVGGHLEYRLRDGDRFRSFFDSKFWSYEAYGYFHDDEWGTLKAGQIWKRFGLDWDGVFFGNVAYFDGFKLDPDYGVSWEKTTEIDDRLSLDSFVQFFFHEDGVNGSFGGADSESVPGVHERNTAVVRLVPTWTRCDGSTVALGVSGLAGKIDSNVAAIPKENVSAWALDLTYAKDRWKMFGEVLQSYGRINPARYVSGGPSNRITDFLAGVHYTDGPVTYRASYSAGIDDNPYANHGLVVAGTTIQLTEAVELYVEYVNQQVDNNNPAGHIEFFDSVNFIVHWTY